MTTRYQREFIEAINERVLEAQGREITTRERQRLEDIAIACQKILHTKKPQAIAEWCQVLERAFDKLETISHREVKRVLAKFYGN